jgi:hypothetical protein
MAQSPVTGEKRLLTERSFLFVCIVLGAMQAWITRYAMSSDGVSYLDIGDAYLRRDWAAAVNAYWSPMYSWCLGFALYLFRPSIWWEYPAVHAVNLVIYVVALFSFRFFIHSILRSLKDDGRSNDSCPLPDNILLALGYSIFLWCSLVLIDVVWVTPDLLVAAFVFLICGYLIDLRVQHSYWKFAAFGGLCGAAYLSKGIMFSLGIAFLTVLFFSGKPSKPRVYGVLLSAAMFLIVCSPFVWALSKAKGRLTFGDTGRLAYASQVSPNAPSVHWQGEPAGSGTPRHPTRRLFAEPTIFEFAEPVSGTYPAWDDPSYWNEGVQWRFRVRSQIRVLIKSALTYQKILLEESGLLAGVLFFLIIGGKPTRRAIASNWPLLAAAGVSLAAYSLVLVLPRYVGASMVILWAAVFGGVRLAKDETLRVVSKYVAVAIIATVLLSVVGHIADTAYLTMTVGAAPPSRDQVKAAVGLQAMGLRAGDKVAVIGDGGTNHWARLGRFRIVAEAVSVNEFWSASPERRHLAYECLSSTGSRAVVAWAPAVSTLDSHWQRISDTNYYAYFFPK